MKDCCFFPLSFESPTTYIFSVFYVFSPILNGLFCRMDDAEACFILSSRNEVDRMAAVRNQWTQILDSVARSRCKKATVFIRTTRQSWEPGQWRTLPQTAPFMFRYSNRKISSMSNLQVSLFRQSFWFFPLKQLLWDMALGPFLHLFQIMLCVRRSSSTPCWL